MTPRLNGIDHLHVYVTDLQQAEEWYGMALGLHRDMSHGANEFNKGPLMLGNPEGNIHLALFEEKVVDSSSVIAFSSSGENFLAWKSHLENLGLKLRVTDHNTSFSLYFSDPDNNLHEITSHEHDVVLLKLS